MPRSQRTGAPRKRPGGRSARVVAGVHAAVLHLLATRGYQELSIHDVAKLAKVHETSIYRRWRTKANLVSEVIARSTSEAVPPTNTGSFHADMASLLRRVVERLRTPLGHAVSQVVASQDPELLEVRRTYWSSRLHGVTEIVRRAKKRGELPCSLSPRLVLEMFSGPILLRFTSGQQVSNRYIEELVARVTQGLKKPGAAICRDAFP